MIYKDKKYLPEIDEKLSLIPLFDENSKMWYLDQMYFLFNGYMFRTFGTETLPNTSKDYILNVELPDGVYMNMKMSELVQKYRDLEKKLNLNILGDKSFIKAKVKEKVIVPTKSEALELPKQQTTLF